MNGWTNRMPLALLVLCLVTTLCAQDITKGSIGGVVRDSSGAVIAGAKAANAEPFDAPRMLTARPIHKNEITATRSPWTNACKARSRQGALNRLVPKMMVYTGT